MNCRGCEVRTKIFRGIGVKTVRNLTSTISVEYTASGLQKLQYMWVWDKK